MGFCKVGYKLVINSKYTWKEHDFHISRVWFDFFFFFFLVKFDLNCAIFWKREIYHASYK